MPTAGRNVQLVGAGSHDHGLVLTEPTCSLKFRLTVLHLESEPGQLYLAKAVFFNRDRDPPGRSSVRTYTPSSLESVAKFDPYLGVAGDNFCALDYSVGFVRDPARNRRTITLRKQSERGKEAPQRKQKEPSR